ncbi:MAG: PorT family protein [Lewinellaceae bacterium]|nr:PorT family protein [Lewinellaceae bacterium]
MKWVFPLLILFCTSLPVSAQLKLGLRMGMSTTMVDANQVDIPGPAGGDFLKIGLDKAHFGIHGGLIIQARLGRFLLQPELLLNSNRVDYRVDDLAGATVESAIRTEKFQYLDLPLFLGVQAGPFHLQAGPEAHFFINSSSELFDYEGYEQKFDQATFGWIAGVGLDVWNLMLDLRYEGNFSKFGSHITFNGQQYAFDNSPSRILLSLGVLLGKRKK